MDGFRRLLGGPSEFEAVVTVLRRFEGIRGESWDEIVGSVRGSGNDRVRVVFWLSLVSESPMHPNWNSEAQCRHERRPVEAMGRTTHQYTEITTTLEDRVPLYGCVALCTQDGFDFGQGFGELGRR
jgi:hypothetical protein